jgi:hypothetical protein
MGKNTYMEVMSSYFTMENKVNGPERVTAGNC